MSDELERRVAGHRVKLSELQARAEALQTARSERASQSARAVAALEAEVARRIVQVEAARVIVDALSEQVAAQREEARRVEAAAEDA